MSVKDLPPALLSLLIHPAEDTHYTHFLDGASHPFQPGAVAFSAVNAWWLADAALLAYWDSQAGRAIWERAGLASEFIARPGTQCHLAWTDRMAIVAFRGTEPTEAQDLLDIIRLHPRAWPKGGNVHEGVLDQFLRIWSDVEGRVRNLGRTRTIWFAGHSLGGALATLALDQYGSGQAYTIGSPRVGDRAFASGFNARNHGRNFRYVNNTDVVTLVPPNDWLLRYTHIGARKFIDAGGGVSDTADGRFAWLGASTQVGLAVQAFRELRAGPFTQLPPLLADHIPSRYAVRIWNAYDAR